MQYCWYDIYSKGQTISEWIYEDIVSSKKSSKFLPSVHRVEILAIFCLYLGRKDDFINLFWNILTFTTVHLDLENDLILLLYFFFKNAEKITSGGLILSLKNFCLILFQHFSKKIYAVKTTNAGLIISELVFSTT